MTSILSDPHFHNEDEAYKFVEAHLWPNGPVCPRCKKSDRIGELKGGSTRRGVRKCYRCRKPFTVKVNTIFESSHVPLNKWLQAIFLMCSSKKGISSNQLHRTLGVTLKTAWFMSHRIREAMRDGELAPLGGTGKIVEVDETYYGKAVDPKPSPQRKGLPYLKGGKTSLSNKCAILSLVERRGSVRSFHIAQATKINVQELVSKNVARESALHTDESRLYGGLDKKFADHQSVRHSSNEYVRGEVSTNTVESVFSVFKRGMRGTYQHCAEKHLHRYLAEFDFRYNARVALGVNDTTRAERALRGVVGKRLTYETAR